MIRIIVLPTFCLILSTACNNGQSAGQTKSELLPDTVRTFILKTAKIEKQISLPGELLPYERVEIHPKLSGYIRQLKVDIGSVVRKGQVLAVMDAPEIGSKMEEVSGKMQAAKARYQASRDTYQRILEASRTDGVIAGNELERARNQMLADSADYKAAVFSTASFRQIGDYLVITAPYNGIITQRNVNQGSYAGNPGERPILVIEDNSRLRLQVAVPEALTGTHLNDNKIRFATRAAPDQLFEATLVRRLGSIDAATRTELWEFEVRNDHKILKPGAFANAKLEIKGSPHSFVVPFSAVVTTLEKKFVIRISRGLAEWIDVSQGINLADRTEIFGDLKEQDTLVIKGNEELKAGTKLISKLNDH